MKPQPFDLKFFLIEKCVKKDKIVKEFREGKGWNSIIVGRVISLTTEYIKKRIKSACEFYLKYKDNPELLIEEFKGAWVEMELSKFREFYAESKIKKVRLVTWNLRKYNAWLFKLAFKSVLEKV